MNKKSVLLIILLVFSILCDAAKSQNTAVKFLKLSDRNIKIAVKKYNRLVILFHSKWCENSRKTFNTLSEMAKSPLSEDIRKNRIVIAHFMSKDKKEILSELGVSNFPEIRFWNDGAQAVYDGEDYSQENIWKFI